MKVLFLTLLSAIFLTGCCNSYCNYCVEGVDEFVIDSYRIRQGKLAILELQGIELEELPPDVMDEYKDVIYEDDILNIAVYHPTRRDLMDSIRFINDNIGFRVVHGYVDIPDIPAVEVAGLTLDEAREKLQGVFREQVKDVELFVTYKDRLSRKVDLTGLVGMSTLPVDGKIRLYEVLAKAHVPVSANFYMSYVVRNGCPLAVDMHRLMHKGDMCQNIVMRGGDKIFIADPSDSRVMIMGEVLMPRPVNLPFGYMSLREALVTAGGIPFTGNKNCIQVIRGNMVNPKIYVLAWEHIIHLPNDSLLLMPGDTVYVSETPITQWNRFISQLLPSVSGVQAGFDMYQLMGP